MTPRPYQSQAIQELRDGIRAHRGQPGLLVAPTGSGKSEIFGWMARSAVSKGFKVGAVVNRRILVNDLCKRVDKLGLEYGVIMGSAPRRAWAKVHIASFDTLWRRPHLPKWDLVFVDECHFSLADKYSKVIARLQETGCAIIGMTATPIRGATEGLGAIYKWMVRCPDTPDLIRDGYLIRPRIFAPGGPDVSKVAKVAGEFNQKQLAQVCDKTKLIGDILTHWMKNGRGRPTIGFGVDINHCNHMAEMFCAAGVRAIAVDHRYKGDFDLVWRKLANYETEVVFNVGIAGYGWDCPPVSHMIEARPTQSLGLWLQHCGRIMRKSEGKADAIINDHAGNSLRHGLPDEYREWQLDGAAIKESKDKAPQITTCKKCYATFKTGPRQCAYCGAEIKVVAKKVEVEAGELREVGASAVAQPRPGDRELYLSLLRKAEEKGYRPGYAGFQFKGVRKYWPPKEWQRSSA
jgi:superfamily II DNA or RNA helicase